MGDSFTLLWIPEDLGLFLFSLLALASALRSDRTLSNVCGAASLATVFS
jgi:hypothetical protein